MAECNSTDQSKAINEDGTSPIELRIHIEPRGQDSWWGTRAQLEGEGLIPSGFVWPTGDDDRDWEVDGLDYCVHRTRPDGLKGPKKVWLDGDYWLLYRRNAKTRYDGFAAARMYAAQRMLAEARWDLSEAATVQRQRYQATWSDARFQAFKVACLPTPRKRGRPRKTQV